MNKKILNIKNMLIAGLATLQIIATVNYKILKNPTLAEQKRVKTEIEIEIRHNVNCNFLSEAGLKEAAKLAIKCRQELTEALEKIQYAEEHKFIVTEQEVKEETPLKDRIATKIVKEYKQLILHHIINAKGYYKKMKDLGVPIDKELENIKLVELSWSHL